MFRSARIMKSNKAIRLSFILGVSFMLSSCSTSKISLNRAEMAKVETVAIMQFDTARRIPKMIATECEEAFRGHFVEIGKNVVERAKMKSVIKEIEMSQSGLATNARELGKLAGADALLYGAVTENNEEVKPVEYYEYEKKPKSKETEKIRKIKQKKFFYFQVQARLVSTINGATILTIKNEYPERSYEMTDSMTLTRFRDYVLDQMGKDLKKALEKD
jgi:hypothetical protein